MKAAIPASQQAMSCSPLPPEAATEPTHSYKNALPGEEAFGIFTQHEGRFTVFVGGFPIMVDGQCVGSVAASGGNGEQDIACCEAGIAAFTRHLAKS